MMLLVSVRKLTCHFFRKTYITIGCMLALACVGKERVKGTRTLRAKSNNAALIRLSPVKYLAPRALHELGEI